MGEWVRAKGCSTNSCIEVQAVPADPGEHVEGVIIRTNVAVTVATAAEWIAFVEGIKNGDFDQVL